MRVSRLLSACVAVMLFHALTTVAMAASGEVLLSFGSDYTAPDGASCVHRGADIAAEAGTDFVAPIGGTVRFAGRVPGPHGGSIQAITLDTAAGTVSFLPFDSLHVSKGQSLESGESLGSVVGTGDPSSSAPHVHVSLRKGDLYVDPSVILAAPVPGPPPAEPEPQVDSVLAHQPASAGVVVVPGLAPATVPASALGAGVSLAPQGSSLSAVVGQTGTAVHATDAADASASEGADGLTVGEGVDAVVSAPLDAGATAVDPGLSVVAPAGAAEPMSGTAVAGSADVWRRLLDDASPIAAKALREMARNAAHSIAILAFVIAASVYLLGQRSFERRFSTASPVSDRLGRLLQQLRAGDTLRGLTSCSGHAAFTVPEPFSPGEVTK